MASDSSSLGDGILVLFFCVCILGIMACGIYNMFFAKQDLTGAPHA